MSVNPTVLNQAFRAYIDGFRLSLRKLELHIATYNLESETQAIISTFTDLLRGCEDYLWMYPGGVPWTKAFKSEFYKHLLKTHPWLDAPSFDALLVFAHWICWQEGLNDPAFVRRITLW